MKKALNHEDKQNRDAYNLPRGGHPSQESQPKPFKPAIKVGYKLIHPQQEPRRYKKPIMVMKPQALEKRGVKRVATTLNQRQSGAFIQCEYVPKAQEKPEARFHKAGVQQAHEKYHSGREFSLQFRGQFAERKRMSRSITQRSSIATERSKLSGYKNEGIKDILQYHYAGDYRDVKVTKKCNNEEPKERIIKYSDIHELDFRRAKPLI